MIRVSAAAFLLLPVGLGAQNATDVSEHPRMEKARAEIAAVWEVSPSEVRMALLGGVPEAVDSVAVTPAASPRWILSLWSGDRMSRRFLQVGTERPVPVAARALPRGESVMSDDVDTRPETVWGPPVRLLNPVGMVTQRMVSEGEVLVEPTVRAPLLVSGGQSVEAVYTHPGVSVTMRGEALGRARLGDVVLVRLASGMRMQGRAIAPGRVELIGGGAR
ncbi:MAG: flagellar basal body P-ring formation chaperone FlgA [Gemmatimonadota bacterium]